MDKTRFRFAPFSDCHLAVIKALVLTHCELEVALYREPSNPADPAAVAVLSGLQPFVVGGKTVYRGSGHARERIGQRIGYVSRADDGKRDLAARLDTLGAPLMATLHMDDGPDFWIDLYVEPDDSDEEVPY